MGHAGPDPVKVVLALYPERIVPDETEPGIVALHLKRYEFALPFCAGKDVLDAGCGVGYGSAFLAQASRRVVGVDLSDEAIAHARGRYASQNVEFVQGTLGALEQPDSSFDVICCFETIEHLTDPDAFLTEATRLLRPEGVLVISTPRADQTADGPENPFHEIELSRADFEALLGRHFREVELYGQRRLQTTRHRVVQRLDVFKFRRLAFLRPLSRFLGTAPTAEVTSEGIAIDRENLEHATELIAVCR